MEKALEQNTEIIQESSGIGTVKIADDVVAAIAGIAATEVDGVLSMEGNSSGNEQKNKMGSKNLSKGVKVEVSGGKVKVDITIIVEYGYSIPSTSQKVQERIKSAIENMTGLTVRDVNIRIAGISVVKH